MAAYPDALVTVEGHTDNVGADGYNLRLSLARATSVRTFLLSRPGASGPHDRGRGAGRAPALAPNTTDAGRQQNRRVEIVVAPRP